MDFYWSACFMEKYEVCVAPRNSRLFSGICGSLGVGEIGQEGV